MAVEAPNISGQPTMLVDQQPNLTGPRSHRAMAELDVLVASIQECLRGTVDAAMFVVVGL
jgi:hypothetical protein